MGHNTITGKHSVTAAEIQAVSPLFKNIEVNLNYVYVFTDAMITEQDYTNLLNLLNTRVKNDKTAFGSLLLDSEKTDFIAKKLGLK